MDWLTPRCTVLTRAISRRTAHNILHFQSDQSPIEREVKEFFNQLLMPVLQLFRTEITYFVCLHAIALPRLHLCQKAGSNREFMGRQTHRRVQHLSPSIL
jgi:hypothetical protein